jgi:hypothetical protein
MLLDAGNLTRASPPGGTLMRAPRVLLVLSLAGALAYATGTTMADATVTPARGAEEAPFVEVFSATGTITRVPVQDALRSHAEASPLSGGAAALSAPLTQAEATSAADGTVTTLQNTGPADKRFDLVLVGDGYQESEQELFHQQAAAQWASMRSTEPFASLQASFNVWLVDVASEDSGADNETFGVLRNTALGAGFFCNGIERLLCANDEKAQEYARNAPGADQVAILVNTTKYGGAGGSVTTVAGGNTSATEILIHELGHSIGGLADEYTSPGTYAGSEPTEPNVSKLTADEMRGSGVKWAKYLGQAAPGGGIVDTFAGAKYAEKGIYRPSDNSIMRTLGREFDPVGLAAMRAAILAEVPAALLGDPQRGIGAGETVMRPPQVR